MIIKVFTGGYGKGKLTLFSQLTYRKVKFTNQNIVYYQSDSLVRTYTYAYMLQSWIECVYVVLEWLLHDANYLQIITTKPRKDVTLEYHR